MTRLISVIIPTYNRAKYLPEAIESVLGQKGKGFTLEIIVIDDGSTDNTAEVLEPFKKNIRYKKISNSGRPAVPRNIGLSMARGELVAFQDSDDIWASDKLTAQLPVFDDPAVVLSYGNTEIITETGKKTGKTVITATQAHSGNIFTELMQTNFISTLTVMARPKALEQAGGFNESAAVRGVEDYDLWLRVARLGEVQFINKILANYRSHDDNISTGSTYADDKKILNITKNLSGQNLNPEESQAVIGKQRALYRELASVSKFPENTYWLAKTALAKLSN